MGKWFPLQPASTDSHLSIDGSRNAARKIVQSEDCLRKLKDLACRAGPIERDQIWPSQATIGDSSASPKLSTWAVAGLLKNLSLYTVSRPAAYSAIQCLCILQESEDWLVSAYLMNLHFFEMKFALNHQFYLGTNYQKLKMPYRLGVNKIASSMISVK